MTAATGGDVRDGRGPRARVLVVGPSTAVRELASMARRHLPAVSESHSLYDALHEVGSAHAREPVAAVVVSSECPGFEAAIVADAFRRVDPTVPLVLAFGHGEQDLVAGAIAEGFEDSIPLDATPGEWTRVCAELGLVDSPPAAAVRAKDGDGATGMLDLAIAAAKAQAQVRAQSQPRVSHDGEVGPGAVGDERRRAAPASGGDGAGSEAASSASIPRSRSRRAFAMPPFSPDRAAGGAGSVRHDGPPSDLDLVRAVREGGNLVAVALRAIHAHLGTSDVRFVAETRPGEVAAVARERTGLSQVKVAGPGGVAGALLSGTIDAARLEPWAAWLAEWIALDEQHRQLRRLAWSDELTGAGNRRALRELLPTVLAKALRERRTISLMCVDIDDFKRYNDRYGHDAGDEVLCETVEVLRSCIRPGDHVFRMGGDEFVILFCDPNPPRQGGAGVPETVHTIASRCHDAVRRLQPNFLGDSAPGAVTLSAGFAVFPWEAADGDALLRLADQRALRSKNEGKDQITFGPAQGEGPADGPPRSG